MWTLSVVRGGAVLYLLAAPMLAEAWQTTTPPVVACRAAGQLAGWDLLEHTITLKSDSGQYFEFHYNDSTTFATADATFRPDDIGILEGLNIDDRLCVEAFQADRQDTASRVRVTLRGEIDDRDKRELVRWQAESLFGTVRAVDPINHRITVSVPNSSDVSVDAAGSVAFWTLPAAADDPADAVRGNWESLAAGDAIYVRGERVTSTHAMRASLVVSGGFRSFGGSVESMEPLTSLVRLRDFRSGRIRPVRFDFMSIYVVGENAVPGARDRRLYRATVGDLKRGDAVLIMGRENEQTGAIDAFILITGFSPGGVLQPGPGQSANWIFQAIGFGGRRP
ncbi:MAG: hypothetical protein JWP63_1931 [Candidatus Solibacter sp.]|nr:hypothetical protein [Candidatus Solibacter sp.]